VSLSLPLGRITLAVIVNLALNSHETVKPKCFDIFININESIASLISYNVMSHVSLVMQKALE